jgi:hypothetical protein
MQVALAPSLLAAAALAGCTSSQPGPPAPRFALEGSLGQVMDLGYDDVRLVQSDEDVALLFVRLGALTDAAPDAGGEAPTGPVEDYPLKLSVALRGAPLPAGVKVDLTEAGPDGAPRGTASRNVRGDPRRALPAVVRGSLRLDRPIDSAASVPGSFHVTFENGVEAASGRTVFGSFNAKVERP